MKSSLSKEIDRYIKEQRYPLINSVLVYDSGEIIVENYYNGFNDQSKHPIFSIWKSIISLCVGICLHKQLLKLSDPISDYLDAFSEFNHPYHRLITVEHLLTMTSGIYWNGGVHYHCPMLFQIRNSGDWIGFISDIAMKYVPGEHFQYKEWDVILLSAIISKVTAGKVFDFCMEYLFQPLEIQCSPWPITRCGVEYNHIFEDNNGLDLMARDLLKIGLLLLNDGMFLEKQIVSKDYVDLMKRKNNRNYGFLLWLFDDYFACRGFGGQDVIVSLNHDLVMVIQASESSRGKSYEDLYLNLVRRI